MCVVLEDSGEASLAVELQRRCRFGFRGAAADEQHTVDDPILAEHSRRRRAAVDGQFLDEEG
jgi:hypothetical protein